MYFADAKCEDCNHIYEIEKQRIMDDFISGKCPECDSENTHRIFNPIVSDVAEGKCGNAKTSYSNSVTNHCSQFGYYKGTRVR